MSDALINSTQKFEKWMIEESIPLWSSVAIDPCSGGTFESLSVEGVPNIGVDKRVRVQARQVFAFAQAHQMGWFPEAEHTIAGIEEFLATNAVHPTDSAVYVHRLSGSNQIIDAKQDTYDLAFFLLANAWKYRVFKDERALSAAEAIVRHIDSHLKGNYGGWLEGNYDSKCRRQNPHMHLFEAFLALYDATGESKWLARAGEIFALFESHFFDPDNNIVREYFEVNWTPSARENGKLVEPGHMMEWVWLLRWYGERTGSPVSRYADALYSKALDIGVDKHSGLLFDEVNTEGKVIKASKRCWPITELIKANLAQAKAGYGECADRAAESIEMLFKYYLAAPTPGAYFDQLDGENKVGVDEAPASTLYHLMVALTEAVKFCNAQYGDWRT